MQTAGKEDKYQYNGGAEKNTDFGLNLYETQYRLYDPLAPHFVQVDPKAEAGGQESLSPYQYSFNNPIRYNDPKGDCPPGVDCKDYWVGAALSVVDNFSGGLLNFRGSYTPNNPSSYNQGQDAGDRASIVAGAAMLLDGGNKTITGGGMMTASLAVTAASVGTSSPVTVPTAGAGATIMLGGIAESAYGSMVGQRANNNLTNQSGRVDARAFPKKVRLQGFEDSKDANGVPRCEYCGQEIINEKGHPNSYEADHGNAYINGGGSNKTNLNPACRTCNREKSDKQLGTEWIPPKDRQ